MSDSTKSQEEADTHPMQPFVDCVVQTIQHLQGILDDRISLILGDLIEPLNIYM